MLCLEQQFAGVTLETALRRQWMVDNWTRLGRFVTFGSERGTYHVSERDLSIESASAVRECLREDGLRVVKTVTGIAASGCAPRSAPALFALALAASPDFADPRTNAAALLSLPDIARTAADLCAFGNFVGSLRGWGRGLRSAVAQWYLEKPAGELADQLLKHRQCGEFSHRDLLRLSHPKTETPAYNALFEWAVEGRLGHWATSQVLMSDLRPLHAFERAKQAASATEIVHLIEDYRLTYEMIPPQWRKSARVWEALLDSMPYAALIGHLGKLAAIGLLAPESPATALAVARLIDRRRVANSGVSPIALLGALQAYRRGKVEPIASITQALEEAFHLAIDNIAPTGKRLYLAIDASVSMQNSTCVGMPHVSAAAASAGLAMAFARREPKCNIAAFHDRIWHVDIAPRARLDQAVPVIVHEPRETDASLPIVDALKRGLAVDAFVIVTDDGTWGGQQHPGQALERYRRTTGIPAKLVVIAMAAERCGIANPDDAFQMDVAGFDASVPAVVGNFIRGRLS